MRFFKKRTSSRRALVLDLGSASAGAALVLFSPDNIPHVLWTSRTKLKFLENSNSEYALQNMKEAIVEVCSDIHDSSVAFFGKGSKDVFGVDTISVVLSSPWAHSRNKTLEYESENSFYANDDLVSRIIHAEKQKLQETDSTQIHSEVLSLRVNGYKTRDPKAHKTRKLYIDTHSIYIPHTVEGVIQSAISQYFQAQEIAYTSFMSSYFSTLRSVTTLPHDAVLIDVAGESTDIALIKDNSFIDVASFERGYRTIMRTIVEKQYTIPSEAESRINRVCKGEHCEGPLAKTEEILIQAMKMWSSECLQVMTQAGLLKSAERSVYILTEDSMRELFTRVLRSSQFSSYVKENRVVPITASAFNSWITYNKPIHSDVFLTICILGMYTKDMQ